MILPDSGVALLKDALGYWEWFEYVSTAIVWLGCVGEFIAEFTSFLGNEESKHRLSRLSLLVLILGIAGELLGTVRTSQLSGQLIARIEERTRTAEQRAAEAEERIRSAEQKAAEASERASANEKEATALRLKVEQEKVARLKLLRYTAWRHVNRDKFLAELSGKPKPVSVFILYLRDDSEAWGLSQEIYSLLLEAGWPANFPEPIPPNQTRLFAGFPSIMGVGGNPFGGIALVANEFEKPSFENKSTFGALTFAFLKGLGGQVSTNKPLPEQGALPSGSIRVVVGPRLDLIFSGIQ